MFDRMAGKRFSDESGSDPDQPIEKRIRTRPSFASVIGEVVMVNSLQNFCSVLEPMLRRVVNEEIEQGLRRCTRSFTRSASLRIQAQEPSTLKLIFSKKLSLPIFTGSKIGDGENTPLQVLLVDTSGNQMLPTTLPYPIKVEIVVLDGDFPPGGRDTWTSEEFNNNVVRERTGKRPLLTGDLLVTLRDGFAPVGDIEFTDNSSWIRSRKFRIGARVAPGSCQGLRIREAMTEAFVVKDHRGELYKKHHPPALDDEVWRLEKIGKDGAFHKKLAYEGINTVQDFLKLYVVDPTKLRKILGVGMSDKMWDVAIRHARTCTMGTKVYVSCGPHYTVTLNPICQVVRAMINGQLFSSRDLTTNRSYLEKLVRDAYLNWNSLQEVDAVLNEPALLTQGNPMEEYPNYHQQAMIKSFQQHGSPTDKSGDVGCLPMNEYVGSSNWVINQAHFSKPAAEGGLLYNFSDSSSDDDLAPPRSFINGIGVDQ